ncbi:hypothetical protein KOM00_16030 [Geomonas sp. Red69]|uniref:hypothetical protein n=1 Tax=Geomonas diazotrophica TaxID=2843197 RepID=UPI001C100A80|nr:MULTISPECIES: hypothetical protein [Geomonas]MBU5638237.1 hypothetical protein [Geomonas diazotrophica]QXE85856.1 hypothetical protein KP003_16025 [Geomonas nitrogeniifigens]
MLVRTLQVVVHCEHKTLWNMLMDRLQHPERYIQGVAEARVTEEEPGVFIAEMALRGERVKERVLARPYDGELRHELLEHPQFTGFIVRKIVKSARQSPVAPLYLEYDLDLLRKSLKVQGVVRGEEEILTDLETEMQKVKLRAEESDSRG